MSYAWSTVTTMTVGYLFSGVITHLPILAVLVTGLIVVGTRKARLGPRSATMAQLGLGLLVLGQVLEIIWFMLLPEIISSMDYSSRNYGIMTLIVGLFLAALVAAGLALLIAALVTRTPTGAAGPYEPAQPGPAGPYGAAQPGPTGPYEPAQPAGPYGAPQPGPAGPYGAAPGAGPASYQGPNSPGGYTGAGNAYSPPPAQAPGPDPTWSSSGASGFDPSPPPPGPPTGR